MNNNGLVLKVCIGFVLSILSHLAAAQDCITQSSSFSFILKAKQQGLFRFENEHTHQSFNYQALLPFQRYLDYAYDHINKANPRANLPCPVITDTYKQLVKQGVRTTNPNIADIIAPFELKHPASNKVALLIHGLTDSPFTYHDLARIYYEQGYSVRTLLLPGHGSAASALQNVDVKQWQKAVNYGVNRALTDFDEVILGGYSTGAALVIDYLTKQTPSPKIKALMLYSPGTEPHNKNGWLAKWIDAIPFVDWIDKDADIDFAKYESFPFHAAAASYDAMQLVSIDQLSKRSALKLPIFSVLSDIDTTIDTRASLKLLSALHKGNSPKYKTRDTLVFYGNTDTLPAGFAANYKVINPKCTTKRCKSIHGISHIAIVNSPQNPHYGVNVAYRNCGSFINDDAQYKTCKTTPHPQLGERTKANLKNYPALQRLTFNPHFNELEKQISIFIKNLEHTKGKQL
ncbi:MULTISPECIES: alpha/beta hydrolase [Pseudoalteromonas]|uniref:alpha/beta hydrolase n=1 Tax=Pseudoalteromonas TaxID=53246 RepID=UPI000732241E|nr:MULTISPECIES: alpha/beta fold hydrolase [Pseudoalteromonas]KTF11771.1 esterase [Pseudoalteromonas sp. H103]MDO6465557.1 alpha/beta fold hydrolase [Pseudoalteromonas carrageenovora]MDO6548872.1 alpha/beta fold hydrolase [Pseudoalteromonas carrageenovora]MDO6637383.1 alpha/beta fold hydrolase [Pseudoalteromonas carrageenovora]MDO6649771.1 alpha/beta fold hydrolase [Pseudoalteromonas carrageenovora]